jgi:hypothetical protein
VRGLLFRDQADFERADRNAAVRAVETNVHPGACLQLQHILFRVQRPDAGKGGVKVPDNGLDTFVENRG